MGNNRKAKPVLNLAQVQSLVNIEAQRLETCRQALRANGGKGDLREFEGQRCGFHCFAKALAKGLGKDSGSLHIPVITWEHGLAGSPTKERH